MTDKRDRGERATEGYEDFLSEISQEIAMKDKEKDFMESIAVGGPLEEEEAVNVGARVKDVRERRGLSLKDISQRTGIDEGTLSSIEDGEIAPPLGTIIKLAKALEMKMGYFISGEQNKPFTIVRRNDRRVVSRHDSRKGEQYGYEFESLAPHKKDRHMEPFLVTLDPAETEEERSTHDGQEFIFVLQGSMEVRLGEEVHILDPGDAIYYDSTVPHLVKSHGDKSTKILAVLYAEK
jgi:transcriptional regulator with XRE-family HTH domain